MGSERMYGNVINQLRSYSEAPRYPASKTWGCCFDVSTEFETDPYANRISISKGYDTSTLDDEVTVSKEKTESKTESIDERENPIIRALRKFVEFLNEFVDLFIADWD